MGKFNVYLNQDQGSKWTASYWIAAVSKWVHYTILGDKDGNLIDSAHPLDVKVGSSALPTGAATSAKQDTLAGLIGEVQANPTENTVLERLKALETELVDIKSTSGVKKITDAVDISDKAARELGKVTATLTGSLPSLAAGTAEIGKVRTNTLTSQLDAIVEAAGGPKDITMFLTFSESETGEIYRDLIHRNIAFAPTATGRILKVKGGPLGNYLAFPASQTPPAPDAHLRECPFATVSGVTNPGYFTKYATRFSAQNLVDRVSLQLFKVGAPNAATVKVSICEDDGGVPGDVVTNPQVFIGDVVPVNTVIGSALTTSPLYAGFAFDPIIPTTRGDYYWLVLEYADTTGVDANNYITWGYTASSTGGARAVWDGAAWQVTSGQSFGYRLYNNELRLGDDWSLIFLYNNLLNPAAGARPFFRQSGFIAHILNGQWEFSFIDDIGTVMAVGLYTDVSPGWRAMGITHSREKSQDKICFYADGKPVPYMYPTNSSTKHFQKGLHGWAGHSIKKLVQPWIFGREIQPSGNTPGSTWDGYMGPILLTKTELTPVQMSKITNLMLYGNKEAV